MFRWNLCSDVEKRIVGRRKVGRKDRKEERKKRKKRRQTKEGGDIKERRRGDGRKVGKEGREWKKLKKEGGEGGRQGSTEKRKEERVVASLGGLPPFFCEGLNQSKGGEGLLFSLQLRHVEPFCF